MTEREWQATVVKLLKLHGWKLHTVWFSRHSPTGWPDIFAIRDNRVLAIELKTEKGRVSPSQKEWLTALDGVKVVEAFVLRPAEDLSELEGVVQ